MSPARRVAAADERGAALLALLLVTGALSLVAVAFLERLPSPSSADAAVAEAALADVTAAARVAFRRTGAFPQDLDNLATEIGRDTGGAWRRDPWRSDRDLDYRIHSRQLELRTTGPDRRLGTADDVRVVVDDEPLVRLRQRGRLRILRAVLAASALRVSFAMSSTDRAAMRAAMRDHAAARRAWWTADAVERAVLTTRMDAAADTVAALRATYGLPAMPTRLTGGSGLLATLGLTAARAVDGLGRAFDLDPVVGFVARGSDRRRGTDDDM